MSQSPKKDINETDKKTDKKPDKKADKKDSNSLLGKASKQIKKLLRSPSSNSGSESTEKAESKSAIISKPNQTEGIIQSVSKNQEVKASGSFTSLRISPPPDAPKSILLPPPDEKDKNKICLVVDLDETLVHSVFQPIPNPDIKFTINFAGILHGICVLKRPGVDQFLTAIASIFECVLFTASLQLYADPLMERLDKNKTFKHRLYRDSCTFFNGTHVKDLTRLGRPIHKVVIIDNSPAAYMFQPDNAIPISSFFDDPQDTELLDLIPFLQKLARVDDIYKVLKYK